MKAIVLSCDKYIKFADHMITTYQNIWSSNPFIFRLPYENYPHYLKEKYGNKVELIHVPGSNQKIKLTVLTLLEDLDDEDWIYWCMDDKYLVQLREEKVNEILKWVRSLRETSISGICFARVRNLYKSKALDQNDILVGPKGKVFFKRQNYSEIWVHQFLKVKALRRLFESFPDREFSAKEMDKFKRKLQLFEEQKLYVSKRNLAIFGESTTRGMITTNCANSFAKFGMTIPHQFDISSREIIMGKLNNVFVEFLLDFTDRVFCNKKSHDRINLLI